MSDVTLAVLVNMVERLRAEQALVKSMLVAINVQLGLVARHMEHFHVKEAMARDDGPKVGCLCQAGGALAPDPARGLPRS